jgi:hypothetical protein
MDKWSTKPFSIKGLVCKTKEKQTLCKKEIEYFVSCATQVEQNKGQGGNNATNVSVQKEDIGLYFKLNMTSRIFIIIFPK